MCIRVVVPFWINVWESQSLQLIIAFLVSWPVIVLRCISLVTNDVELFYVLLGPPYIFFDEMPIHIFYTFLIEWFFLIFEFWILKSILKSRNITLPIKVHIVKAMVFPVVMYGCESWTIKKAELFIIARTWKQPRCSSADEWIRKLWYIYTMEYDSAIKKNTFESVLMRWMKLEPIIQSEVSQKEKHQYSILTHIYGI